VSSAPRMHPVDLERLADLVAVRLARELAGVLEARTLREAELVDATEIATRFGVSRDFVYAHADELGAVPLGTGPKPRLRFDPAKVADLLAARSDHKGSEAPNRRRRRRRRKRSVDPGRTPDGCPLLPIRAPDL
jgi:hypothetical protein